MKERRVTYSLVWILLRLVVAVLLILPGSTAPGRALLAVLHWLPLRLHRSWVLLVSAASLVVILVCSRLVLVVVLLLILIPASATCGSWISTLPITTPVIVASATLVSALTPAVS